MAFIFYSKRRNLFFFFFILIIIVFLLFFFNSFYENIGYGRISGKSILEFGRVSRSDKLILGDLNIVLNRGELLPKDSYLDVRFNDIKNIYQLSNLVSSQSVEGDFYISGLNLKGYGEGYGRAGERKFYPNVKFKIGIKNSSSDIGDRDSKDDSEYESKYESNSSNNISSSNEGDNSLESSPEITGLSVLGGSYEYSNNEAKYIKEIEGEVSKENQFIYNLSEGESAELIYSEHPVQLTIQDDHFIVSTSYYEKDVGFGDRYLIDEKEIININLSKLNLPVEEGILEITIVYNGLILDEIIANVSLVSEYGIEIKEIDKKPKVKSKKYRIESYSLTNEELSILRIKTGEDKISIVKSQVFNNRLIVRFKIGEYWLENSYDYSNDKSKIENQIRTDMIRWAKNLALELSTRDEIINLTADFIGDYPLD